MKQKKRRAPTNGNGKAGRATSGKVYPDNDPEWDALEERYSQIGSDMRRLAELIPGDVSNEFPTE